MDETSYPEKLPRARDRYYSTALDARGLRANAPIALSGCSHRCVCLTLESLPKDLRQMIGRALRTLANTECIQTPHHAQDAKHQNEAIKENFNKRVQDHSFKPSCDIAD